MLADMQEQLQLALSKVIPEDLSPSCLMVFFLFFGFFFYLQPLLLDHNLLTAYTTSSSVEVMLYVAYIIHSKQFMKTHQIHIFFS